MPVTIEAGVLNAIRATKIWPNIVNPRSKDFKENFQKIVHALSSPDPQVREYVLEEIKKNGSKVLEDALTEHYKKNYDSLLEATQKHAIHLLNQYDRTLTNVNNDTRKGIGEIGRHHLLSKDVKTKLEKNEPFDGDNMKNASEKIRPLISQMNAIMRAKAILEKPVSSKDLAFYRDQTIFALNSLHEQKETLLKVPYTDYKTITKDRHPVTKLFSKVVAAVSSALLVGAGVTAARMLDAKQKRGHHKFWEGKGYDFGKAVEKVEKDIHTAPPKFKK